MVARVAALPLSLILFACAGEVPRTAASRPPVGLAIRDTTGAWCAALDSTMAAHVQPGTVANIVVPGAEDIAPMRARIRGARTAQCSAAFPQPRWDTYRAFDVDTLGASDARAIIGVIVLADVQWTRTATGTLQADIDGDGRMDELRRCAADEGEHFTVWSPAENGMVRWAHEYFDWGAIVDPTCKAGEDGRDSAR
jgi:hypothetical protein